MHNFLDAGHKDPSMHLWKIPDCAAVRAKRDTDAQKNFSLPWNQVCFSQERRSKIVC